MARGPVVVFLIVSAVEIGPTLAGTSRIAGLTDSPPLSARAAGALIASAGRTASPKAKRVSRCIGPSLRSFAEFCFHPFTPKHLPARKLRTSGPASNPRLAKPRSA